MGVAAGDKRAGRGTLPPNAGQAKEAAQGAASTAPLAFAVSSDRRSEPGRACSPHASPPRTGRWVGHATSVMAMGQTVVKMRTDPATGELRPADVPDHVDILAAMACGAQAHLVFSAVSGACPWRGRAAEE